MEITEKTSGYIEAGTAAALGFITWVKTATAKFEGAAGPDYSTLKISRIEDALALIIGNKTVKSLDPSYTGGADTQFPNIMGALNPSVAVGAGFLVADYIIRKVVPNKYYKNVPVIPQFVRGAGIGIVVGGIIGGIWDPEPSPAYIAAAQNNRTSVTNTPRVAGSIVYTVN